MPSQENVTKNRTQALIAKLKQKKYDPLEELINIAQTTDSIKEKREIALALLPYCYPKLKHVEVDAQINHGITVQVTQFLKPDNVKSMENPNASKSIAGHGQPVGIPSQSGSGDGKPFVIDAEALPVGAGGHPDILPDPELSYKGKTFETR